MPSTTPRTSDVQICMRALLITTAAASPRLPRSIFARRAMSTLSAALSARISATDVPCIVQMQQMLRGKTDVLSLAQGIVHWPPPEQALAAGRAAMLEPDTSMYGADDGILPLRDALKAKLAAENGIVNSEVMVTAGANQAYTNIVLTLMDAGDPSLLYRPYYFNHLMALQMTGSQDELVLPPNLPDLQPDLGFLKQELERRAADPDTKQLKMITLCNPGNPTGVMIPKATLEEASALCKRFGVWLIIDNTYEHFAYADCPPHECIEADHIVNVFSFSKAFGMMGWRVGYVAFPPILGPQLFKVQDTIAICPTIASQKLALGALSAGRGWVTERVDALAEQKALVLDALHTHLGAENVKGGSGAIYLFCKLPEGVEDDMTAVRYLVEEHGVCLIPGSACGMPGHVRVCYANVSLEKTREAAKRLHAGLGALAAGTVDLAAIKQRAEAGGSA